MDESVAIVQKMIASKRSHHIVTANVDFLVQSLHDEDLHRIFLDANLLLCDGTPLVWASRLLGNPLPERVAGSDLVPRLIQLAEKKKYRIFLLGGSSEANSAAVENLKREHPKLIIAGHYAPPFAPLPEMNHQEICDRIREAKPDLLLVSFGCPKQEKWIAMHYQSLGVPVVIGVGAVIDFVAQRVKRAPVWMQQSGTEWLFRLAQEPRRLFRRYAVDLYCFGFAMMLEQWHNLTKTTPQRLQMHGPVTETHEQWQKIHLPSRLDSNAIIDNAAFWHKLGERHCLLNLEGVEVIDGVGMGLLVRLHQRLKQQGHLLMLYRPSEAITLSLKQKRLHGHFVVVNNEQEAAEIVKNHQRSYELPASVSPELN
ncbi:MAG: WecB/TagA/CpsF family glycosyl transferase [Verrucomicrobia bacterium]|nr:WecB/TagA/CpsF family glycosyl transferase [Verrucomicrobiota bacterium]